MEHLINLSTSSSLMVHEECYEFHYAIGSILHAYFVTTNMSIIIRNLKSKTMLKADYRIQIAG